MVSDDLHVVNVNLSSTLIETGEASLLFEMDSVLNVVTLYLNLYLPNFICFDLRTCFAEVEAYVYDQIWRVY